MAYDSAGALHVAYQDAGGDTALRYTTRAADGAWSTPAVVDPAVAGGAHLSIEVNASGTPGIAYYDPAAGDLKYAAPVESGWQPSIVDFKDDVGLHPALAFDRLGRPVISFYSATKQDLKLAKFNGKRWRKVIVDAKNDVGRFSSIDVSPTDGSWAVAYEATSAGQLKIRSKRDRKVALATWAPGTATSAAPGVAFDGAGALAVSFAAPDSGTLMLYRPAQVKRKRVWSGTPVSTGAMPAGPTSLGFTGENMALVVHLDGSGGAQLSSSGAGGWSSTSLGAGSSFALDPLGPGVAVMHQGSVNEFTGGLPAPATLTATPTGPATVELAWAAVPGATGYAIQRGRTGGPSASLASVGPGVTSFADSSAVEGETYTYRVSAVNGASVSLNAATATAALPITPATGAPRFLLTPSALAELRAKASATSGPAAAQWNAFRTQLDNELVKVTAPSYQADQVMWASDFALAYQVLKNTDPATASAYADKAIAMLLSALRDNARNATGTRMLLARGDGATTVFPVPHTAIRASTVKVWTPTVNVRSIVKGAANGQDTGETYQDWLKVSLTSDGPAAYTKGVDWRFTPDLRDDKLDWSLPGAEPTPGTTYYVTQASSNGVGQASGWTFNGSAIVFNTAPAANRVVYVEYQYGTPSGGASTLGYQQTSDGRGGFNNSMIDAGYTSRFLKHAPVALDWLWDYAGLSSAVRSEAIALFVRWSDQFRDNAYQANSPASNYGAGHYAFRTAAAIALQSRSPDAARLAAEVQAYRQNRVLPIFQPATGGKGSMDGGFWAEGWNYGALAVRNIITSAFAFESAGWAPGGATAERAWAGEVIHALLSQQPTQATVYDGGDGYAYPLPFPDKDLLTDLAAASSDPAMKSYANWTLQNYPGSTRSNWEQMMYRTPDAPSAFWGPTLPLHHLSTGTGTAVARKDWNYNSTWLSFHSGNLVEAEHQSNDQGGIQINRGGDALLVNVAAVTGDQTFQNKSTYGNLVVIDDGGAGEQTYRYAQGGWYGNPGVTMPHFDGAADYVYMKGDYAAAYTRHYGEPGAPNAASELTRSVFYVRAADYVIVYDRATTTQATHLKQLRWHFTGTATVAGDAWTITTGASKLFGRTYSGQALATSTQTLTQNGESFNQITTNNAAPTTSIGYVTAMQTAASTAPAMDASQRVASGDGKVEGVQIGGYAILFGTHGVVSGGTSYQVTAAAGQTLTHYVSDLVPGATYTLTGAVQASAAANAEGVVTFTSSGTGAAQTITLSR